MLKSIVPISTKISFYNITKYGGDDLCIFKDCVTLEKIWI